MKRANAATEPDEFGLGRTGVLELRLGRHTAVRQRMAHRVAEVERALATVLALAGEPRCELAGERLQCLAQLRHLLTRRVHELDVLGKRLAQRLRHGLDTAVGDEAATDLGLDLFLERVDASVELVTLEPFLQIGELGVMRLGALLLCLHQLLEHAVEVEVPQRAVEVVRATHRAPRLHARKALHGLTGERLHECFVALHQSVVEQLHELLGRQRVHRTARLLTLAVPLTHLVLHLLEELVDLIVVLQLVLRAAQREIHLEDGLEGTPVRGVLHHGGGQGELEGLAVLERDELHGLEGIEVLRERHRDAGVAEFSDETVDEFEHEVVLTGVITCWRTVPWTPLQYRSGT